MQVEQLKNVVVEQLEDLKAKEISVLDVKELSTVTDYMVVASGTSNRHVKSVAHNLVSEMKEQGIQPLGVEGDDVSEWVLVDFSWFRRSFSVAGKGEGGGHTGFRRKAREKKQ